MILNDKEILRLCKEESMIFPFEETSIKELDGEKIISKGLSSFGYDISLGYDFEIFSNAKCPAYIDPKEFNPNIGYKLNSYIRVLIPGNGFALASSHEEFNIPQDVIAICLGKSTYARCGLIVNVTPLEPGWKGVLTMELSNTTNIPIAVYPYEGIAQLLFFRGERPQVTYSDRKGKYQNQSGLEYSKV